MASSASDRANLQTALEYFGTSSREFNRATWSPSTPAGSTIDYATLAKTPTPETSTAINRNLSAVRVATAFTRPDGTQAIVGEPLLKRRYLLTRINELVNTADPNIQRDFGLQWDGINFRWKYVGATGSAVQSSIKTLAQVAAENPGREPNFFEILKAVILNGSVGLGTNSPTFVAAENKYWDTTGGLSADCQIMQIGANIIDAGMRTISPVLLTLLERSWLSRESSILKQARVLPKSSSGEQYQSDRGLLAGAIPLEPSSKRQ